MTRGVIIRAGQNLWEDNKFKISWQGAKSAGLLRGSYWFYDSRANPKRAGVEKLWLDLHIDEVESVRLALLEQRDLLDIADRGFPCLAGVPAGEASAPEPSLHRL